MKKIRGKTRGEALAEKEIRKFWLLRDKEGEIQLYMKGTKLREGDYSLSEREVMNYALLSLKTMEALNREEYGYKHLNLIAREGEGLFPYVLKVSETLRTLKEWKNTGEFGETEWRIMDNGADWDKKGGTGIHIGLVKPELVEKAEKEDMFLLGKACVMDWAIIMAGRVTMAAELTAAFINRSYLNIWNTGAVKLYLVMIYEIFNGRMENMNTIKGLITGRLVPEQVNINYEDYFRELKPSVFFKMEK